MSINPGASDSLAHMGVISDSNGLGVVLPAVLIARSKPVRGARQRRREGRGKDALTEARNKRIYALAARVHAEPNPAQKQRRVQRIMKRLTEAERSVFQSAFRRLEGKRAASGERGEAQAEVAMRRMPPAAMRRLTRAKKQQIDAQADGATSAAASAADEKDNGDPRRVRKRRKLVGRAVALRLRRRRTQVAQELMEEGAKRPDSPAQEKFKRAAVDVLKTPMRVGPKGKVRIAARRRAQRAARMGAFGYFPGAAYDGHTGVPQMTDVPGRTPSDTIIAQLRRAITAHHMPIDSNWPGAVQVPSSVHRLPPGVQRQGRITVPEALRPPMPPSAIRMDVPPMAPARAMSVGVPAAAQHPLRHGTVIPRTGPPIMLDTGAPSQADKGGKADAVIEDVAGAFAAVVADIENGSSLAGIEAFDDLAAGPGVRRPRGCHRMEGSILQLQGQLTRQLLIAARAAGITPAELKPVLDKLAAHQAKREAELAAKATGISPPPPKVRARAQLLRRTLAPERGPRVLPR